MSESTTIEAEQPVPRHVHIGAGSFGLGMVVEVCHRAGLSSAVLNRVSGKKYHEFLQQNQSYDVVFDNKADKRSTLAPRFYCYENGNEPEVLKLLAHPNVELITTSVTQDGLSAPFTAGNDVLGMILRAMLIFHAQPGKSQKDTAILDLLLTWVALGFLVLDHGSGKIVIQAATQSEQPVAEGFCSAVDSLMRCPQGRLHLCCFPLPLFGRIIGGNCRPQAQRVGSLRGWWEVLFIYRHGWLFFRLLG